jgi:hypothetical protein
VLFQDRTALYPDALLSQVLVAATHPLEVAEAAQWLQQNRNLRGQQPMDAARRQNWDRSVQALVVFPDVIGRLGSEVRWTADLGNAFLAQQADVMNAVQRKRAQARAAGGWEAVGSGHTVRCTGRRDESRPVSPISTGWPILGAP